MLTSVVVALLAALALLAVGPASAHAAITSCALTGTYALSAAATFDAEAQLSGQFIFTPPGTCAADAVGTVHVNLAIVLAGAIGVTNFFGDFPYFVFAAGEVRIGTGLINGRIAGVAPIGIANALVFEASPVISPPTVRFAGTAVRVDAEPAVLSDFANGNTAVGPVALPRVTPALLPDGHFNTAVGLSTLFENTTGHGNTAVGAGALGNNTTGHSNVAIGRFALINSTGSLNIAVGASAGLTATTGDFNIYIGHLGFAAEGQTIRIGTPGEQTAAFMAGISGATSSSGSAVLVNGSGKLGTTTSARRFKEGIGDMGDASAGLLQLRPVTFRYRPEYDDGAHLPQYGLIAEEVAEIYPELVVADSAGRPLTVRYHLLPAMLLNEVQRQHRLIEAQERRIQAQQTQLQTLAADHARLSERLGRLIGDATAASP
jgi:hypothetical protein